MKYPSLCSVAAILLLAVCGQAQPSYPRTGGILTNYILLTRTNAILDSTNTIQLYKGRGLSLVVCAVATNDAATNVVFTFDLTSDNSTWTTTRPLVWSFDLTGTNYTRAWTNFPAAIVDNMRKARLATATNGHDASVTISNLDWSITP